MSSNLQNLPDQCEEKIQVENFQSASYPYFLHCQYQVLQNDKKNIVLYRIYKSISSFLIQYLSKIKLRLFIYKTGKQLASQKMFALFTKIGQFIVVIDNNHTCLKYRYSHNEISSKPTFSISFVVIEYVSCNHVKLRKAVIQR